MSGDGEERDVRDSLSELERRLLDLERELRVASSEDRQAAAGVPTAPPAEPPAAAAPAPPAPPEPGSPAPEPPGAAQEPGTPAGDPEVARLAAEAQTKLAALRASLDGLESASDRLRETAQTMVEDHGRTLVRLERAGAAAPPPVARPAASTPAARPSAPAAPAPVAPRRQAPPPPREPPPATTAGDGPSFRRPSAAAIAAVAIGTLALVGVLVALLSHQGGSGPSTTPRPAPDQRVRVAADVPRSLFAGERADSSVTAIAAVCSGAAPAAVVSVPASSPSRSPCAGATVLADEPLSVTGVALRVPRGGGGRTCVAAPAVDSLVGRRRDAARTAERRARIAEAQRSAAAQPRGGAAAAEVRAVRSAGAAAARRFDAAARLRLLSVSTRPGGRCVPPTDAAYPLGDRIRVIAAVRRRDSVPARRAAELVRRAYAGPVAVDATVLRSR